MCINASSSWISAASKQTFEDSFINFPGRNKGQEMWGHVSGEKRRGEERRGEERRGEERVKKRKQGKGR